MKKSVIKRRKRVIPATQGGTPTDDGYTSAGSPPRTSTSPRPDSSFERGSSNPDGSINLGFKRSQQYTQPHSLPSLSLVPESTLMQNRPASPVRAGGDLARYQSSNPASTGMPQYHPSESLSHHNRLPPIQSIAVPPSERQPSLSPASFLSPSRKRSFSAAEPDYPAASGSSDGGSTKRLSSIKSLLILGAPGSNGSGADDFEGGERDREGLLRSPESTAASAPSPGAMSSTSSGMIPGGSGSRAEETGRLERREMLRREAERMREELAKKERELAEYGM